MGAFELLASFRSIESRGAIQAQMMSKLADILEQFEREIVAAHEAFDRGKGAPPLTRNQPPVAGVRGQDAAAAWVRLWQVARWAAGAGAALADPPQ